jgi:hypothetical protein
MNRAATWRAILALSLWACSAQFARGQPASVSISILQPATGALSEDALNALVTIASSFEVADVLVEVEGRQTNLVFSPTAFYQRDRPMPGWTGALSLSGLATGPKTLTATATDVFGNSAQAQVAFVYDRKPVLTVTEPLADTVARGQVRVAASCTDDDPAGCRLTVSVTTQSLGRVQFVAGRDRIDQTVSLAAYDGSQITLSFQATDSARQTVSQDVPVYVESSQRLNEAAALSGAIWDVQPERILYCESRSDRGVLKIRERATGRNSVVMDQAGLFPKYGYLTPKGAIFLGERGDVLSAQIYEQRDNTLLEIGSANSWLSLAAKGNYAIWNTGTTLTLRDLAAGTNTTITGQAGNWNNAVALDGDVAYWSSGGSYNIYRYAAGITTQLTTDTALWNVYPLTDETSAIYRKNEPCCGQQRFGVYLHDGIRENELAPLMLRPEPLPGRDYQLNNGWAAFTRPGNGGPLQVWTRSPAGQLAQITYYGDSSGISALAPNGQVMFLHSRRYLSAPGHQALEINSRLGAAFWQGGDWWITIGRSLFKVNTETVPMIGDILRTTPGHFAFQVSAANGQAVIVQASADLISWQNLQTNAVAGTGFLVEDPGSATMAHRFYRVLTP